MLPDDWDTPQDGVAYPRIPKDDTGAGLNPPLGPAGTHFGSESTGEQTPRNVDASSALIEDGLSPTSNIWSTTRQRSTNSSSPAESSGDSKPRFPCDYPNCMVTLSRSQDIDRHKSSVHKQGGRYNCLDCKSGFPRKDKLTAHVRRKHKELLPIPVQDVPSSAGSPEMPADTAIAHRNTCAPDAHPLELPNQSRAEMLGQVTSNCCGCLNAFDDANMRGLRPATQMPFRLDPEPYIVGVIPPATTGLLSVGPVPPLNTGSGRNPEINSCIRQQYSQQIRGQVQPGPGFPICASRVNMNYFEGLPLRDTQNTAAVIMSSNSQQQPGPQTHSEWFPYGQTPMAASYRDPQQSTWTAGPHTTSLGVAQYDQLQGPTADVTGGSLYGTAYRTEPTTTFPSSMQQSGHAPEPSSSQQVLVENFLAGPFYTR